VEFAVHSGMRIGELTGLMWSDISFNDRTVRIHQQLIYDSKDKRKLYISDVTKNGRERTIKIPQRIIALLVEYKEHQQQEFNRKRWRDNGMVFSDYRTGGLIPKSAPDDWFASFCKKKSFRHLSPHSFRHFYATMLYAETKDPALVAKQIGDEIATVIKYYVHAEDGSQDKACDTIANAIEKVIGNNGVTLGYEPEIESLKVAV
jgi:ATP-dependent helicase/nuclease subunit A